MNALLPLLAGLGTGLALIVAIGVQNTYLLRLAVIASVRVVAAAVVVCAASDAVLILAGVLGVGVVVERFPLAVVVIRFVGAAFLLTYGVLAAKRALRPSGDAMRVEQAADDDGVPAPVTAPAGPTLTSATAPSTSATSASATSPTAEPAGRTGVAPPGRGGVTTRPAAPTMRAAVLTMLVFTWANPHVYLDTLVFLGSVANQQGVDDRWWWTIGAVAASCLWFGALGFGGRLLRPLFARRLTWRVFDGLVAVVMLSFGVALAVGA
ncbi:LysE family transporter [Curtobacterium flaccumfaciens pv. beticola]|uniref:LysE/ArgO family amino acid transporter n=1 Tax=Curtobacterium flaccumfaciens TaxID=2035 RepID=UPI00349F9655|nr:LysE family transporter [Curtobacterium flaccumfaciens pv. basellae]